MSFPLHILRLLDNALAWKPGAFATALILELLAGHLYLLCPEYASVLISKPQSDEKSLVQKKAMRWPFDELCATAGFPKPVAHYPDTMLIRNVCRKVRHSPDYLVVSAHFDLL